MDVTIHQYIQRRQLTEAARQLIFSNKSVLEIALLTGYESQQAFTAVFKAMYKQSPTQFRNTAQFYPLQSKIILQKECPQTIRIEKASITFAVAEDITLWMNLVQLILDGFPRFVEHDYRKILKKCIHERRAFIVKDDSIAIGVMILSYKNRRIDFLGIHPQYRRKGIAKVFLDKVKDELLVNSEITVTTFREGDAADNGSRKILKKLGFIESDILVEFGYPTQKMILPVNPFKNSVNG
jgi:predicted GNAT family acetyltransferase